MKNNALRCSQCDTDLTPVSRLDALEEELKQQEPVPVGNRSPVGPWKIATIAASGVALLLCLGLVFAVNQQTPPLNPAALHAIPPPAIAAPTQVKYRVAKGEASYGGLAQRFYKSAFVAERIQQANQGKRLKAGDEILLPVIAPQVNETKK